MLDTRSTKSYYLLYAAFGLQFGIMIALSCCEAPRRKFPMNIILLFVYTLVQGFFLGVVSMYSTGDEVKFYLYIILLFIICFVDFSICWNYCSNILGSDTFCIPVKIRFHDNVCTSNCFGSCFIGSWNCSGFDSDKMAAFTILCLWNLCVFLIHTNRYSNDDWW